MFSRRLFWFLMAPTLVFLVGLGIYPTIYALVVSFQSYDLTAPQLRKFIGGQNYADLLSGSVGDFWGSLLVTIIFTVAVVALEFLLGFGLAMLLSRDLFGGNIARSVILLPLGVSSVIVGMIFRLMYNQDYGIINYLLNGVGLPSVSWLTGSSTALLAVILADVWQWTPFMFLIILAGVIGLPSQAYEAAAVDGASRWMTFRRITLPLLKPVILVAVLLRGIDAFKTFDQIFVMTQGGPGTSTLVLSLFGYKQGFKFFNIGQAAALAWMMLVMLVIGSTVLIRLMRAQGVKL